MNDKVIRLEDEVERLKEDKEELLDELDELEEEFDSDEYEVDEFEDTDVYEDMDTRFMALELQIEQFEKHLDDGAMEFRIRELSFGEVTHIRDEVMEKSEDPNNPREGLYKVLTLDAAVEDGPVSLSDDHRDWPSAIGEWVYDKVDEMNTGISEERLGNLSLEDARETR